MKRKVRRKIALIFVCSTILCFSEKMIAGNSFWKMSGMSNEFYNQLITISTVIVGFAFTNMGLMLSVVDSKVIQDLKGTDILSYKSDILIKSIVFCCGCLMLSFIMVIRLPTIIKELFVIIGLNRIINFVFWNDIIKDMIFVSSVVYLSIGVYYFILSIKEVSELLRKIYKPKKMSEQEKEIINTFLSPVNESAEMANNEEKDIFKCD